MHIHLIISLDVIWKPNLFQTENYYSPENNIYLFVLARILLLVKVNLP